MSEPTWGPLQACLSCGAAMEGFSALPGATVTTPVPGASVAVCIQCGAVMKIGEGLVLEPVDPAEVSEAARAEIEKLRLAMRIVKKESAFCRLCCTEVPLAGLGDGEALFDHVERVHHMIVRRTGESPDAAVARVRAKVPEIQAECPCPACSAPKIFKAIQVAIAEARYAAEPPPPPTKKDLDS
jgi:hypothetical protein